MFRNITIISTYAPTNDKDDQEKEIFYGRLEETCNKTPKHDTVIIMGDFNAKLGNNEYPQ